MMAYLGLGLRVIFLVAGWLVVIFLLWRRFRLDIDEKQILAFGLWSGIFAIWIGFYLRIWIGVLGMVIILGYISQKNNWDGFEIADYFMPLAMIYIGLATNGWPIFILSLGGLLVNANFRKFSWYKSGKPGLGGLCVLAALGIYLVIYGFNTNFIDQVAGIWVLTASVVGIYLRSRLKLVK